MKSQASITQWRMANGYTRAIDERTCANCASGHVIGLHGHIKCSKLGALGVKPTDVDKEHACKNWRERES